MDTGAHAPFANTLDDFLRLALAPEWPAFRGADGLDPAAQSFLAQIHEDADPDDLRGMEPADLVALAHEIWAYAAARKGDARLVRVRRALGAGGRDLGRDVIEVAGPDAHFLVDSVMAELRAQGALSLALFHPVVKMAGGGKLSMIQAHLEPMSPARAQALEHGVRQTLDDVDAANTDFLAMKARMHACAEELRKTATNASEEERAEGVAFLEWLAADNFTFLGVRDYQFARDEKGNFIPEEPIVLEETGLGILRDPDRFVLRRGSEPSMITPEIQRFLQEPTPLVVSKSNLMSRVHRRVYADYVGMKRYDAKGEVVGETRFVGLFTAVAYDSATRDVPLLRRKTRRVLERAAKDPASHNGKTLQNIVENYPRDELFQISEDELLQTSLAILHLFDRPRAKVFARRDRFDRFASVMAFVPKERFNSTVREAIGLAIARAYGGRVSAFYPLYGDAPLARIHFIIGGLTRNSPNPDPVALDVEVAALTRTWEDAYESSSADSDVPDELADAYARAFTLGYKERFDHVEGLVDVREIAKFAPHETVRVRAFAARDGRADKICCKVYAKNAPVHLSAGLPVLENMGLFVENELTFPVRPTTGGTLYIHDIEMRSKDGKPIDFAAVENSFEEAFAAVWTGRAENDGFNALILKLGMSWREAALIRALARYRQQTGLDPSQPVQEQALCDHPEIVRLILGLFRVRFSPDLPEPVKERETWARQLEEQIDKALEAVVSLDADRVLRRIARLVSNILRTNFYQTDLDGAPKAYMSFKIASADLEDLPAPKPYREIWVSSPDVEGVHLRFGPVARGGLRWSDRRDDFRTEVLDLVKAQQVKNAIIVPVGAKGGFFPKKLPPRTDPNWAQVGQDAYKTFLRGLLDITDNIVADKVKPPVDVIRWDGDDPYLVVAADKGTATFSDIANGISAEYGHWLGDAFASGGSVGYDHKGMGITAKGAWVAVQRHFREIGKDIQKEDFTVIGVGDMSGDVFGNGMLLSPHIKLVAAFDHRDIFLDPSPDPAKSFAERKRLFDLPRSSWKDYDPKLLSKGGGIYSRSEKSIPLTEEVRALVGFTRDRATPTELMNALLKAPCELLWFGGIGAYVKAAHESNADVGDKANDAIRVDGRDVRAAVIGEGANLGVTQAGRIEFARKGGRINTDAVDNSAGVDTSDHEVNIKILLAEAERQGAMKPAERVPLLEAMTDDVGRLVLDDNYDQTRALTLAQASAVSDLDSAERFMERLEKAGKLSRTVEGLPSTEEIRVLREQKLGLTRPELAKLLAYAKIDAFDAIVASDVPDDAHFEDALVAYFPPQVAKYKPAMLRHRLRREIVATGLADDLVNMGGPTFVDRVRETARADTPAIARAFEVARRVFRFEDLSARIDALDNKAPAATQSALYQEMARAVTRASIYLLRRSRSGDLGAAIAAYQSAVDAQRAVIWDQMTEQERQRADARAERFAQDGAPADLARDAAALPPLVAALDVADIAERTAWPVPAAATVFRQVGAAFGIDRLRGAAMNFTLEQHWDRLALRRTLEELYEDQRMLAEAVIRHAGAAPKAEDSAAPAVAVRAWMSVNDARVSSVLATIGELEATGAWTFAKTILAATEIRGLSTTA
ncbi:MAG: NAD-glutamate dehydrogenase [Hyphomonadaceae bacterium]|nr:NAD-glutamate dehydrogenase [Hyphomonadaceae bacterium]